MTTFTSTFGLGFIMKNFFFNPSIYTTVQKFGEWKSLIFNKAVFILPKIQ